MKVIATYKDSTRTYTWTHSRLLSSMGGVNFVYDGNGLRYFYDRSGINAFTCDGEVYGYVKNLFGDIIAYDKFIRTL